MHAYHTSYMQCGVHTCANNTHLAGTTHHVVAYHIIPLHSADSDIKLCYLYKSDIISAMSE